MFEGTLTILAEVVVWVLVIRSLVKTVRKSKKVKVENTMPSARQTVASPARPVAASPARPATVQPVRSATAQHKDSAAQDDAQMSTTEYLQQKANLDAREHARQEQQERRALMQETGGAGVGERLYEGCEIPDGKRKVTCRYCAAENLTPQGGDGEYTCYFCREFL